jgi:hypothetical protein
VPKPTAHDSLSKIVSAEGEFHGTLGGLDFQFSAQDHVLHVWGFVTPGAGPLLRDKADLKATLDKFANDHPEETANAVFDIRTLDWNKQVSPKLEPCLYLKLDIADGATPVERVMNELQTLSRTSYIWNREKMLTAIRIYKKDHPRKAPTQ